MASSRKIFDVVSYRQLTAALLVAVSAGAFLAAGFLNVSTQLVELLLTPWLPGRARIIAWSECAAFPLLAMGFYFSFPRPTKTTQQASVWLSLPFAIAVAFAYGLVDPHPGIFSLVVSPETQLAAAWTLFFAPVGEEFLFRGWVYSLAHRLWPRRFASATNPLPLAVWVSAVAFSLWHLQNWGADPAATVFFQVAYTLPAGLWLGWLRWKTGGLFAPLCAHVAINLASALV